MLKLSEDNLRLFKHIDTSYIQTERTSHDRNSEHADCIQLLHLSPGLKVTREGRLDLQPRLSNGVRLCYFEISQGDIIIRIAHILGHTYLYNRQGDTIETASMVL